MFIQGEGRQSVRIQTELSLAHGIQGTLVPEIDERRSGIEIYGATVSSDKVGGDLVDVVPLRDGTVVAYLADIAGHWLPAGILMGMVKTAVRTQLAHSSSPTALFESLNEVLPGVKEPQMYATCTALRIANLERSETAVVEYAIAGQPAILHVSASKHVTALSDEQFPLGLLPNVAYTSKQLEMRPGDVLVVATDGLLEAEDAKGEAFGLERLSSVLLENLTAPLDQIAERIRSISRSAYRQLDDQTLLLIRFAPRSESTRA
jgi:serine phosphatase RsbU (regulator of sigma subunit)